jgi:hypothetical protein
MKCGGWPNVINNKHHRCGRVAGEPPYLECPGFESRSRDRIFRMNFSRFSSYPSCECQASFLKYSVFTSFHIHPYQLVYYSLLRTTGSLYGSENLVCYIKERKQVCEYGVDRDVSTRRKKGGEARCVMKSHFILQKTLS